MQKAALKIKEKHSEIGRTGGQPYSELKMIKCFTSKGRRIHKETR